jgi:hypothetical protein
MRNLKPGAQFKQEGLSSLVQNSFRISLSPDFISTVRIPFSFIDWMVEVGGFSVVMFFIFKILTHILR